MNLLKEAKRTVFLFQERLENNSHLGHLVRELGDREPPPSCREQRIRLDPKTLLVVDKPTGRTTLFDRNAEKPVYGQPGQEDW